MQSPSWDAGGNGWGCRHSRELLCTSTGAIPNSIPHFWNHQRHKKTFFFGTFIAEHTTFLKRKRNETAISPCAGMFQPMRRHPYRQHHCSSGDQHLPQNMLKGGLSFGYPATKPPAEQAGGYGFSPQRGCVAAVRGDPAEMWLLVDATTHTDTRTGYCCLDRGGLLWEEALGTHHLQNPVRHPKTTQSSC